MRNKIVRTIGLGIFVTALASAPLIAAVVAADVVRARIDGFRKLGASYKTVRDELNKGSPSVLTLRVSAREIGNAAKAMPRWFPQGSGPQPGIKTGAKPEIWSRAAEFKAAQKGFAAQTAAFMKAAASGNIELMRAENKKLGGSCGSCHRTFRNEEKS